MIFVGVDWAEAHHDVCVLDEAGAVLARLGRMSFQPEDAADAWQRIFAFFETYLS